MRVENLQVEESINDTIYITNVELNSSSSSIGITGPTGPVGGSSSFQNGTSYGNYLYWDTNIVPNSWTVGSNTVTLGEDSGKINAPPNSVLIGKNAGYNNAIANNTFVVGKGNNTIYYGFQNKWTPLTNNIFTQCNAVTYTLLKVQTYPFNAFFTGVGSYAIAECFFNTTSFSSLTGIQQNIISKGDCIAGSFNNKIYFGGEKGTDAINSVIASYDLISKSFTGVKDSAKYLSACYSMSYNTNNPLLYFGGIPIDETQGCIYEYNISSNEITSLNNTLLQICYKAFYYNNQSADIRPIFAAGTNLNNNNVMCILDDRVGWTPLKIQDSQGNNIFTVIYDFIVRYIDSKFYIISVGSNRGKGVISYTNLIIDNMETTSIAIPDVFEIAGKSIQYSSSLGIYEAVGEGTNTFAYSYDGLNWVSSKVDTLKSGFGLRILPGGAVGDNIAIGNNAGNYYQGKNSIAIGTNAGNTGQKSLAVAIGSGAGQQNQGFLSIAIGTNAGKTNQSPYSIALNASDSILNPTSEGFYVKPVTNTGNATLLNYNTDTGSINYTKITKNTNTPNILSYNEDNKTINYSPISSLGYTTCSANTTTTNGGVGPMYILNNTGNIVNISISSSDLSNNIPINQIADKSQLFIPAKIIWFATDTNGNPTQVNTVSLS